MSESGVRYRAHFQRSAGAVLKDRAKPDNASSFSPSERLRQIRTDHHQVDFCDSGEVGPADFECLANLHKEPSKLRQNGPNSVVVAHHQRRHFGPSIFEFK